jgi:CRP/FNR family transcriptional regulator
MDLSNKAQILAGFPLFSGLEPENLDRLASIAVPKKIAKKSILFREGEESRGFYLLVSGKIKLSKVSPSGKEQILHFVHPGHSFAEAALYMNQAYPATAQAIEESELLYLPREALAGVMAEEPNLSLNLVAHLARYLQILTRKVEELSLLDATARVALHVLAGMNPDTGVFRLSAAKGQVAASLGMAVETFSRSLARLKEEGTLKEASPGVLQVLDREALEKYSA